MDEYLVPNASFNRLWKEYKEHGSLVVAFDFDNTIYDFHKNGNTYEQVIDLLRELKKHGCYLICFTANSNSEFVVNYMLENKIPFHSLNENPPFFKCEERKIYFNVLLDDRAGLIQTYSELKLLITMLNTINEN